MILNRESILSLFGCCIHPHKLDIPQCSKWHVANTKYVYMKLKFLYRKYTKMMKNNCGPTRVKHARTMQNIIFLGKVVQSWSQCGSHAWICRWISTSGLLKTHSLFTSFDICRYYYYTTYIKKDDFTHLGHQDLMWDAVYGKNSGFIFKSSV